MWREQLVSSRDPFFAPGDSLCVYLRSLAVEPPLSLLKLVLNIPNPLKCWCPFDLRGLPGGQHCSEPYRVATQAVPQGQIERFSGVCRATKMNMGFVTGSQHLHASRVSRNRVRDKEQIPQQRRSYTVCIEESLAHNSLLAQRIFHSNTTEKIP